MFRHEAMDTRRRKGDRLCGHVPFPRSKGILPGLLVAVGLQAAVPVVGHGIALLRTIRFRGLAEHDADCGGPVGTGFLMPAPALFPSQPGHACHHLNWIHFETVLKAKSVCSVNPSLDVYFNSVSSYKVYRRKQWKKLLISKIKIKSAHKQESEKRRENI